MRDPSGADLRNAAVVLRGLDETPRAVLLVVDTGDGIVASCTEADEAEIRGLMFRAAAALPGGKLRT